MFCFDLSMNLELKDILIILQTAARALCKITNIEYPDIKVHFI